MARSIHYRIAKDTHRPFTDDEISIIMGITLKYNSGDYQDAWTRDRFTALPIDLAPSENVSEDGMLKRHQHLKDEGLTECQVAVTLQTEGIAKISENTDLANGAFQGSVCVEGNEYNAYLVFSALVDISKCLEGLTIDVSDEGRFLLCDLKLRNGKVQPQVHRLREDMKAYCAWVNDLNRSGAAQNDLRTMGMPEIVPKGVLLACLGMEFGTKYLSRKLTDIAEIEEVVKSHAPAGKKNRRTACLAAVDGRWFDDPFAFTRPVNPIEFADYHSTDETMMDGYDGEGFGLAAPEDPEKLTDNAEVFRLFRESGIDIGTAD